MLVTADEWEARIRRVVEETPHEDYRALEAKMPQRLGMRRWFEEWVRDVRPNTRRQSRSYALTWQWIHVAHGHLDLSPAWRGRKPTAKDRARYRQFEKSLDGGQQLGLALALHKRA
jgi:hypothetical protein